jgi:putative phosphoribosyl transferase
MRGSGKTPVHEHQVRIPINAVSLDADLAVPEDVSGVVIFAHGSGSGRRSPRNRFVADMLQQHGLATLLLDLLTPEEERIDLATRAFRFDIERLATRLGTSTDWVRQQKAIAHLEVGYFGASTGAAAALSAAAARPGIIHAIVSRGGRPDLAEDALDTVDAATLLIVGGDDASVIPLNERALARLHGPKELVIVPGATHLFEEPGALEEVARLASGWFGRYLRAVPDPAPRTAW